MRRASRSAPGSGRAARKRPRCATRRAADVREASGARRTRRGPAAAPALVPQRQRHGRLAARARARPAPAQAARARAPPGAARNGGAPRAPAAPSPHHLALAARFADLARLAAPLPPRPCSPASSLRPLLRRRQGHQPTHAARTATPRAAEEAESAAGTVRAPADDPAQRPHAAAHRAARPQEDRQRVQLADQDELEPGARDVGQHDSLGRRQPYRRITHE